MAHFIIGLKKSVLYVLFFFVSTHSFSQPFTVVEQQNMSNTSAITVCGSEYTFSFTQTAYNFANMQLFDNGTRININSWTKNGVSYLDWGDDRIGSIVGSFPAPTSIYVILSPTNQSIVFSTNPPECIVESPLITVSEISLSNFSYILHSGPSVTQFYTVTGSNLTSPITISAPNGYEISTSQQSGFLSSLELNHQDGNVSQVMYVRLAAGGSVGNYSGNILHVSQGVEDVAISVSGNIIETSFTKDICIITEFVNETIFEIFTGGEKIGEYVSGNSDKICFTPVLDGMGADVYIMIHQSQQNAAADISIYFSDFETIQEIQVNGTVLSNSLYSFFENELEQMELHFFNIKQQPHNSFIIETGDGAQQNFIVDLNNGGFFKVSSLFLSEMSSYKLSIQNEMNEEIYTTSELNDEGCLEWTNIQLVSPGLYTYLIVTIDIQNNYNTTYGEVLVK